MTTIPEFEQKVSKNGQSSKVITIPAYLIRSGLVDPKKRYRVILVEVKDVIKE